MEKTIVLIAGDEYHREDWLRESLAQSLAGSDETSGIRLSCGSVDDLESILQSRPDGIVLSKENRLNPKNAEVRTWMTPDREAAIADYVEAGGSWLAWHSGLASYVPQGNYVRILRGYFTHHPKQKAVTYRLEPNNRFDLTGEFELVPDEHYFTECLETDTHVFLRAYSEDGESAAGWCHSFGKGRVCCFTPAHREEGLLDPSFLALLNRTVTWCLER